MSNDHNNSAENQDDNFFSGRIGGGGTNLPDDAPIVGGGGANMPDDAPFIHGGNASTRDPHDTAGFLGFSIQTGLPEPVLDELKRLIDANGVTSTNMADKGKVLAQQLKPFYEKEYNTPITNIQELEALVFSDGWRYIQEKEEDR